MRNKFDLPIESGAACPACGEPLPFAVLTLAERLAGDTLSRWSLGRRDHLIGRDDDCDIRFPRETEGVSRRHAILRWNGKSFDVTDKGSSFGTAINGDALTTGGTAPLRDGDRLTLGNLTLLYQELRTGSAPSTDAFALLGHLGAVSSLDPAVVVQKALRLLRQTSGTERAYLVDAGADTRLAPLLTSRNDPSLRISRTAIDQALAERRRVSVVLVPQGEGVGTRSMAELQLSRTWVAPVLGRDGEPIAAVYLDSKGAAVPFDEDTERLMAAIVEQIALALRNASLHGEIVSLNEGLEAKVRERTKALEESQGRVVAQDRLATLGRLVAAIAHELNNPVGAIASLAKTLEELVAPITTIEADLASAFPSVKDAAVARQFVNRSLESATAPARDTRARRALEADLRAHLEGMGASSADDLARRFARAWIEPRDLDAAAPLVSSHGDVLARLAERMHTFGRATRTIADCAANVARMVDGLKTYAHLDRAQFEEADVHRSIEATLTVFEGTVPDGVEVVTRFDSIPPFPHRPGELTQVWTNLIDNALRAMGPTGTLTVSTRDLGPGVEIRVADTGSGIPDALRNRIFDLDVTSRGPGAGLGLGLPICKSIIEKHHGGSIAFESRPGRTEFVVKIPKTPPKGEESPS